MKHLALDIEGPVKRSEAGRVSTRVAARYGALSVKALQRDLKGIEEMGLVVREGDTYRPNLELLRHLMPPRVVRPDPGQHLF